MCVCLDSLLTGCVALHADYTLWSLAEDPCRHTTPFTTPTGCNKKASVFPCHSAVLSRGPQTVCELRLVCCAGALRLTHCCRRVLTQPLKQQVDVLTQMSYCYTS